MNTKAELSLLDVLNVEKHYMKQNTKTKAKEVFLSFGAFKLFHVDSYSFYFVGSANKVKYPSFKNPFSLHPFQFP